MGVRGRRPLSPPLAQIGFPDKTPDLNCCFFIRRSANVQRFYRRKPIWISGEEESERRLTPPLGKSLSFVAENGNFLKIRQVLELTGEKWNEAKQAIASSLCGR